MTTTTILVAIGGFALGLVIAVVLFRATVRYAIGRGLKL